MKVKTEPAYAWMCDFGLCRWAEPTKEALTPRRHHDKPSPEAKAVRVRIVELADYKRLLRAAERRSK